MNANEQCKGYPELKLYSLNLRWQFSVNLRIIRRSCRKFSHLLIFQILDQTNVLMRHLRIAYTQTLLSPLVGTLQETETLL